MIDNIFAIDKLYEKFSFTYQGIGYGFGGSNGRANNDNILEILGQPDSVYPSQSFSLGRYYYKKHDLHIVTHHGQVYFVEKGRPEWVERYE